MAFAGLVPWRRDPLDNIRRDFDRMFDRMVDRFDRFLGEGPMVGREGTWLPEISLGETEKEYLLQFELPGVDEKDVKLEVTHNSVLIHGKKEYEGELKGIRFLARTRSEGLFERVVSLPATIDPNKARARYRKGVLEVILPKVEQAMTKSIPIELGDKK